VQDCIFCKLVQGKIPCQKVYEDERVVAVRDINPQAPVHLLVLPRSHLENLLALDEAPDLGGHCLTVLGRLARQAGVAEAGFRVVVNTGAEGGQSVNHLHFHLLGGRAMGWPPG